jgi:hypothetical protein
VSRKLWSFLTVGCLASVAFAAPKGTVPRSSASRYSAHTQGDGISIGARLLSAEEARKTFVSDVTRCCVVIEFAIYPEKNRPLTVSLDNFILRLTGSETAAKPSSAKVISATLQKKAQEQRDVSVSPTVGVGYGSGKVYDPATGTQRGGGVYTTAGVGVGIGSRGNESGSSEKDRAVMETELSEKGLPEGATAAPVAGFLYFSISRAKKATYRLEYILNRNQVELEFQAK